MAHYLPKALKTFARSEYLVSDIFRYGGVITAAVLGANEWFDSYDAAAATEAMRYGALLFTLGEASRGYHVLKQKSANALQWTGHIASAVFPCIAFNFMGDGTYQPEFDLGPIVGWVAAQIPVEVGKRHQEYDLGFEVVSQGRDVAADFLNENASDEELARYVGNLRKRVGK